MQSAGQALILGSSFGIALPVARSLNAHGVCVDMATSTGQQPRLRTRSVRRFHRLPDSRDEPDAFRHELLDVCRRRRYGLLVPAGDSALVAVERHYSALASVVPVGCPGPDRLTAVLDKSRTLQMARSFGIPVPATRSVSGEDDLTSAARELDFPVVVKPRDKYGSASFKAKYFMTAKGLRQWYREASGAPGVPAPLHVQEYVPGRGVLILALTDEGAPVAPVLQQVRLKELPPTGGLTVRGRIERPDAALRRYALRLFEALEWTGPVAAEFRRDPDSGRVVLLEVNGRYWASLDLTLRAGVDLPVYHWTMNQGQQIDGPRVVGWGTLGRWLAGDLLRQYLLLVDRREQFPPRPPAVEGLIELVGDFFRPVHDMVWRFRDPLPALSELARTLLKLSRRIGAAVATRVVPWAR